MLLQFSIGNCFSFKKIVTLSMVAASIHEHEDANTFTVANNLRLLKSAAIYGANASGKTNIFNAMTFMKIFAISSSKDSQAQEKIRVARFKLSSDTENEPSLVEVVFIHEDSRYRYGFQVDENKVHREWLFYVPNFRGAQRIRETRLFNREQQTIELGENFKEGKDLEGKTRSNALFLSVAAQFNGLISQKVLSWFKSFNILSGLSDEGSWMYSMQKLKDPKFKDVMMSFIKRADLGIEDLSIEENQINPNNLPGNLPDPIKSAVSRNEKVLFFDFKSVHKKFNSDGSLASLEKFKFDEEESEGTKKYFALSGPIIDTLQNGKILLVDELDSRLHPLLSQYIVELFNSSKTNTTNAQLIFASHDINSLNHDKFRRDQVWFVEKDKQGATDLYALSDYKVRKDASFGKDYLSGKYGAIPFIDRTEPLFQN